MTQASWPATTYAELAEIIRRNETAGDAARRFARGGRLIPDSILAARITDAIKRGKIPPRPPEYRSDITGARKRVRVDGWVVRLVVKIL